MGRIRKSPWLWQPSGERVQVYREVREIVQRPGGQEVVDERQRCLQSPRQRCVAGGADERVQPDQAMTASLKARDLLSQLLGISPIPPVRDQQHHGASMQDAAAPSLVKPL